MHDFLMSHQTLIRLGIFAGGFAVFSLWEIMAPLRALREPKIDRWFANLGITLIGTIVVRLIFLLGATGIALEAAEKGWGLFNYIHVPFSVAALLSFVVLDMTIYLQHVVFHRFPLFRRFHMMHHTDLDLDVTSGSRFHPIEYVISMLIKMAAVVALGAPAASVFIFEVVLNLTSMFNHSNIRIPGVIDAMLRWLVVTPDMHRAHHSVSIKETNSNFGFNLPWWDRLFKTCRPHPERGQRDMTIGLANYQKTPNHSLVFMLTLPFNPPYS